MRMGRSSSILLHAHSGDQYPSRPHLGSLSLEGGVREGSRKRTASPPTSAAMRIDPQSETRGRSATFLSDATTPSWLLCALTFQHMERMLVTVACCSSSSRACFRSFILRKLVSVCQDVLQVVSHRIYIWFYPTYRTSSRVRISLS